MTIEGLAYHQSIRLSFSVLNPLTKHLLPPSPIFYHFFPITPFPLNPLIPFPQYIKSLRTKGGRI